MRKLCTYLWIIVLMAAPSFAGLVAQWDFSDGTYDDQVGSNNGAPHGVYSIVASGHANFTNAIQTGATRNIDYFNVGTLSSLNTSTNSFTLSFWVNKAAFVNANGYVNTFESKANDMGITSVLRASDQSNPNMAYTTVEGYDGADKLLNGATVADGNWHWIVVRYDGDTDTADYFEDGRFFDTETGIFSLTDGARNVYIANGLDGLMGDIRIYDNALTYTLDGGNKIDGGELYEMYPPAPPPVVDPDLVAHWDFNDGTYNDQAGSNNGSAMGTISIVASGHADFTNAILTGSALDDVLNVGPLSSLNFSTNSFTLSYWVARDPFLTAENGNNYRRVFESNNSGTSAGIQTTLRSSDTSNPNKLYSSLQGYGGATDPLLNGGTIADSVWHWIVIRYNGDTDSVDYFEDGHYYETEYGVFSLADGSRNVYIGNGMGGMIGDIRIYNYALSYTLDGSNDLADGELYAIYGAPVPPSIVEVSIVSADLMKMIVRTSLVATNDYYPMTTPDLAPSSWVEVPHSKDGSDPFIVTNLAYSTTDGTNDIIYVKVGDAQGFFGIGE